MNLSIKKISALRLNKGLTVTDFTLRVGISRKTYYDWTNGEIPVAEKYAPVLVQVLQCELAEITEAFVPDQNRPEEVSGLEEDIRSRLREMFDQIIGQEKLSNTKLARILRISTSSIDSYRRGVKIPKLLILKKLQERFAISIDWIISGEGGRLLAEPKRAVAPALQNSSSPGALSGDLCAEEFVFIPQMMGTTVNGSPTIDGTGGLRIAFRRDWITRKGNPQDMSLMKVQGDSMEPTLMSGDLVMVDQSQLLANRGGLYAIAMGTEINIKRLHPLMGGKLLVISDNDKYKSVEIEADSLPVCGQVIWFAREIER